MIQFRFGLRPVDDIRPWGGETPYLSWFSLTDGWYGLEADGHHLFRYSDGTYVDYYVVRLWEDVLVALPEALEPVPNDLLPFVADDHSAWLPVDNPETEAETEAAVGWYGQHSLDMGYLRSAPHIRWWRTVGGVSGGVSGEASATTS
ncbi:DUF5984 family protein [Streptomyces sp. NBC_01508]|uniref:DUF5984 family protein n=1 Tax=Streptomyces sp. NBC_01508 TaxID=2903888 RepID=UPI00386F11F3